MLFLLEASWNPKTLSGTAPRSEGGRRKACNATPPKSNSARVTISVVTATSVTFGVWVLVLVLVRLVLIKANRLACGQPVRSSLWWLLLKKRHFPQDSSVASTSFFFPTDIALLLSPGWAQSSSSPWRRCFLPLCWCFNNLHSNVISKLASIVSSGRLCAMKLHSILCESPVVWEPMPAKVTCWEKNKWMEITVALQPWMPYQLGNNREKVGRKKKRMGPLFVWLGLEVEITCVLCFW